jgi:hypothetical protein
MWHSALQFSGITLNVILLIVQCIMNVVMLSFVMPNVIVLNVIVLTVIVLNVIVLNVIVLNVIMLNVIMLSVILLSIIMLSVIMLFVIMLNVVMLSVMAPYVGITISNRRKHKSPSGRVFNSKLGRILQIFFVWSTNAEVLQLHHILKNFLQFLLKTIEKWKKKQ